MYRIGLFGIEGLVAHALMIHLFIPTSPLISHFTTCMFSFSVSHLCSRKHHYLKQLRKVAEDLPLSSTYPPQKHRDLLVRLKTLDERIASSFDGIETLHPDIFDNPVGVVIL